MQTINYILICALFLLTACGDNNEQQASTVNDFSLKPHLACDIDTTNALPAWGCNNKYAYIGLDEKNYLQIQADFLLLKDGQCIMLDSNAVKSNIKLTLLAYKTEGMHNVGCSDLIITKDETPEICTADANYSIRIRSRKTEYATYACFELKNVNFEALGLHYDIITTKEIDVSNTPG